MLKAELEEEISLVCSVYKSMNLIWNLDHRRFWIFEEVEKNINFLTCLETFSAPC